jgi:hypothetical protein
VVREVVEEAAVSVMAVKKTLMSDNSVSIDVRRRSRKAGRVHMQKLRYFHRRMAEMSEKKRLNGEYHQQEETGTFWAKSKEYP